MMVPSRQIEIRGYRGEAVPHRFFEQEGGADHLAVILPGRGYTAQMPLLFYPVELLLARGADVLVLCCYLAQAEITNPYMEHLAKDTIACSDTVGKIAKQARVKKLVLTHFGPKPGAMMEEIASDVALDYDGHVILDTDLCEMLI